MNSPVFEILLTSIFCCLQKEGEALSRRNGELEATVRKLRSAARDVDSERERLMARIQTLEAQACRGLRLY